MAAAERRSRRSRIVGAELELMGAGMSGELRAMTLLGFQPRRAGLRHNECTGSFPQFVTALDISPWPRR
jgi:hypothetical protein